MAHFKNPEVSNANFTFRQIHHTALKGIIGAVIGLEGYNTTYLKGKKEPEFLTKLEGLGIGIVPNSYDGKFPIEELEYINQTGHASEENGGILLVYEEVLFEPSWDIYLDLSKLEVEVAKKIEDYVMNSKAKYFYYLGRNHYGAIIENSELLELNKVEQPQYISSLFDKKGIVFNDLVESDADLVYGEREFFNSFFIPTKKNNMGYYDYKSLYFTNYYIENIKNYQNRLFIQHNKKIIEIL